MNEMLSFTVERTWDLPPKVIHCWMASKLPDVGCNLRPCPCSLSCVRRPRREVSSSAMADGLHWCRLHPSRHYFWLFAIVSGRFWVTITLPSGLWRFVGLLAFVCQLPWCIIRWWFGNHGLRQSMVGVLQLHSRAPPGYFWLGYCFSFHLHQFW
jgi:hypothetical protein